LAMLHGSSWASSIHSLTAGIARIAWAYFAPPRSSSTRRSESARRSGPCRPVRDELTLERVGVAKGNLNLLELDAILAHLQPRPHRLGRVVLIPDHQRQPAHWPNYQIVNDRGWSWSRMVRSLVTRPKPCSIAVA